MVKFLLQRPIAVLMAFTACFIIGLITYFSLPVSLLPDIPIPQIVVQVVGENSASRELENSVVLPLRRQLLQVSGLKEIKSETHDDEGIIHLEFEFGVNVDLAFIEVNEKIDAAMNSFPKEIARPKAIKASATDIPVFYLNLTLKADSVFQETDDKAFFELCELSDNVVKRRLEQLPEVVMADITGLSEQVLQIIPDKTKLAMTGVTIQELESALANNNVKPGSMLVRDGYYEYNIRIATLLRSPEDVKNIYLRKGEHLLQLKDLCEVAVVSKQEKGASFYNGKRAVTFAIIKQADENMANLREKLKMTIADFSSKYPQVAFEISRNQTDLLDYTISNLQQNLKLGCLLIFIVAVLFMGDVRSPLIIGINMIVSVVVTFCLFYFFNVSLNIISLSGLILAVGMMIDSSIVVTENITQYRDKGSSLKAACAQGTTEMITPIFSSSLTTIAVFVPLIFMSGIAGAIFIDQAFAITTGLLVSYLTSIMLLPILYFLFYRNVEKKGAFLKRLDQFLKRKWAENWYDNGIKWVFSHKTVLLLATLATLPLCVFFFSFLETERMPKLDQNELITHIEWNENINIKENNRRVGLITQLLSGHVLQQSAYIGLQDYMLNKGNQLSTTEAEIYLKTGQASEIVHLQQLLEQKISQLYPLAIISFFPPETIFEQLFVTGEADLVAKLYNKKKAHMPKPEELRELEHEIFQKTALQPVGLSFSKQINLVIDREKLLLYKVSYRELARVLRIAFKENKVSVLRSYQKMLPINIVGQERTVNQVLTETFVTTLPDRYGAVTQLPISQLVKMRSGQDLKEIIAGKEGEYIPFSFYQVKEVPKVMKEVKKVVDKSAYWEVDFSGSFFSNKKMMKQLIIILFISLLLMYFIMCAQFESFLQPLIVLIEIPIDIFFGLLALWLCGQTLNLMSAIGLIVTAGIVVNDSILKLDTINELRKTGVPLFEAIHTAGKRRLRAIIMTSLTTILVMIPILFTSDMGSELQQPLAIAMIGSMFVGTLVSLFIVPLIYWLIYRKHDKRTVA